MQILVTTIKLTIKVFDIFSHIEGLASRWSVIANDLLVPWIMGMWKFPIQKKLDKGDTIFWIGADVLIWMTQVIRTLPIAY